MIRQVLLCSMWYFVFAGNAVAEIDPRSVIYIECVADEKKVTGSGVVIDGKGRLLTSRHVAKNLDAKCFGAMGTQSDPSQMMLLRVISVGDEHDVALLEFVPNPKLRFIPVPYRGTKTITQGLDIVSYGYDPTNVGLPYPSHGKIKSSEPKTGGLIETDMNTTRGMSGGPVVANGHLLGIVKQESFDIDGQQKATRFVVAHEFPDGIRSYLGNADRLDRDRILSTELAYDDLCTQLMREQIRAREADFPEAAQIVSPFMREQSSALSEVADYWVTVTTGPAEWIDCTSGNMLKSIYFPMGMMVRPERDLTVGDTLRTVFLTEYGLRVFLDVASVQPVTDDIGYVFANGDGAFGVCKHEATDCDPFAEYRLTDDEAPWPFVSGYQSYLRTDDPEELEEARALLEEMYEFQRIPQRNNPFVAALNPDEPESLEACAIRSARLYTFFQHFNEADLHKGAQYLRPVRYSLCTVKGGKAYNRFETSKLVTERYARERFRALWAVNTVPILPDNIKAATRALFDVALESQIVQIIRCGEPRKGVFTLAGVSRGDPPNLTDIIENDVRRHSVFRQFQVAQAQSPVDIFRQVPLFNEIELSVICDDQDELRNAGSIIVDLAPISGGAELELRLFDLYSALKDQFANIGMPNERVVNQRLREGIMYRVCEYREYIAWRTILFNKVKDSKQVRDARDILEVDLTLMTDHVTHLIMASVLSTDVKLQVSYDDREGCE